MCFYQFVFYCREIYQISFYPPPLFIFFVAVKYSTVMGFTELKTNAAA